MKDFFPKGTGNSRYLKSSIPATITHEELVALLREGTFPIDLNGINAEGVAQQGTALSKTNLLKDATAALFGLGTDAVPDTILNILSKSVLYTQTEVDIPVELGSKIPGDIVYFNENGSPVPFYVADLNYQSSYNTDRVLLVRKDCYGIVAYNNSNVSSYPGSNLDTWLNNTYKNMLDADIQDAIGTTVIRYSSSPAVGAVSTMGRSVFQLGLTEYGLSDSVYASNEGSAVTIASDLRIAQLDGVPCQQWTRTPRVESTEFVYFIQANGTQAYDRPVGKTIAARPAFTLPSSFVIHEKKHTSSLDDVLGNTILQLPAAQIVTGSYVGTGSDFHVSIGGMAKLLIIQCIASSAYTGFGLVATSFQGLLTISDNVSRNSGNFVDEDGFNVRTGSATNYNGSTYAYTAFL